MTLDFTIGKFRELCEGISITGYEILTIREYIHKIHRNDGPDRFIVLRHDIDVKPERGLKMAEIEKEYDIQSTYYIRMSDEVFNPRIIKKIAKMRHEVGYHYEVLDKARGNKDEAIKIFKRELERLREVCDVDTICMHGNSVTPWDNRDIWTNYNFEDYGIIGEAYLSINFDNILYLSDTGRNWGNRYKVKDGVYNSYNADILQRIKTTDDVIELLNQKKVKSIYLLSHPWWVDSFGAWLKQLLWQNVKNIGKVGIVRYRDMNK